MASHLSELIPCISILLCPDSKDVFGNFSWLGSFPFKKFEDNHYMFLVKLVSMKYISLRVKNILKDLAREKEAAKTRKEMPRLPWISVWCSFRIWIRYNDEI